MEIKTPNSYLSDLKIQQANLANNLAEMGVQATPTELLNVLIPKVLEISGGDISTTDKVRVRFFYRDTTTGEEKEIIKFYNKGDDGEFPTDVGNIPAVQINSDQTIPSLIFDGWTHTQEELNGLQNDVDVGAMYHTENGYTTVFITISEKTGADPIDALNQICFFNRIWETTEIKMRVSGEQYSEEYTSPTVGFNFNIPFTLPSAGRYMIEIWKNSGEETYSFGHGTASSSFLGGIQGKRDAVTHVFVGDNVVNLGNYAFYQYYSLSSVVIPNSVTSFGHNAFRGCVSLSSVVIPNSAAGIWNSAFYQCYSLSNVVIPSGITSIADSAFYNCHSLSSVVIPSSVTSIADYAFNQCHSLSSVVIPSSVTSINGRAFRQCYSLSGVVIPNGVKYIKMYGFEQCYSLSSVVIPSSVTSIADYAFASIRALKKYIFEATTPPAITETSFENINSITRIYVPNESLNLYKTATNWTLVANHIFPVSEMWD